MLRGAFIMNDDAVEDLLECFTVSISLTMETENAYSSLISIVGEEWEWCIEDDDGRWY